MATGRKVGSGGNRRRGLAGRGPTPKAEDRVYHKAHQNKQRQGSGYGDGSRSAGSPSRKSTGQGKAAGADWVVGRNPVFEAMSAGLPIKATYVAEGAERDDRLKEIFRYAADHSIPLLQTRRAELDRLTGGAVHQGIALQLPSYEYAHPNDLIADALRDPAHPGLLVALDGITDPHNFGAIVRSAAAFGGHGVIIPERRSASVTAVVWKSSAGALARLPVAKATNLNRVLQDAVKAGFTVIGLASEGESDICDVPGADGPVLLVVGSEGSGLARLTRERCDALARIPIASTMESLNASVAASIALYEISRCRGGAAS